MSEFLMGGAAAACAGFFTNPLEVVKIRFQLQGELQSDRYITKPYKGFFHSFATIARHDGVKALQAGLVPALWYQFVMNSVRLGSYQCMVNLGVTKNSEGNVSMWQSVLAGALAGSLGAIFGSPLFLVKTHLQSRGSEAIAVGYQHSHGSMTQGFTEIFKENGVSGLWRGVNGAIARVMVGSAVQLSTFSKCKDTFSQMKICSDIPLFATLGAASISASVVVVFMTPLDVVSTRLYNQGVTKDGKGLLYNGVGDCIGKISRAEGLFGFYKGIIPSFMRLAPHTVLCLSFWDVIRSQALIRAVKI